MIKRKKVLIYVEFASIRNIITKQLESKNFEVLVANDLNETLQYLNGTSYDMFIADYDIQNESILRIIKHMRNTTSYLFTPIILLITGSKEKYFEQLGDYNIAMYLTKPFDISLLNRVLDRMVR